MVFKKNKTELKTIYYSSKVKKNEMLIEEVENGYKQKVKDYLKLK